MRTETDLETLAQTIAKAGPDFDEEAQRIALNVYRRLAEGSPAPVAEIATRAGSSTERVRPLLETWPGVFLDDRGRVVGFWGLAIEELSPTHRLQADGRELFGWCAWDTLFLPGILDRTVDVASTCPVTAANITLRVSPAGIIETSHPDGVVSFLVPDREFDADVVQRFCHFVHFFASADDAAVWMEQRPGTFSLTLEEAFELGRRVNELNFGPLLGSRS